MAVETWWANTDLTVHEQIDINLVPGSIPPVIHIPQYDTGRILYFKLYTGNERTHLLAQSSTINKYVGTTDVYKIQGTKPDGKGFSYKGWGIQDDQKTFQHDGDYYFTLTVGCYVAEQMTVCAGLVDCDIRIEDLGTAHFVLDVEPAALSDDTIVSDTELTEIREAIKASNEAKKVKEQVVTEGKKYISSIDSEGEKQVAAVKAEGETQVKAVNDAGTSQISAIKTEGTNQVTVLQTAGGGYAQFEIDRDSGHLYFTKTTNLSNLDFAIKDHTNLEVTISG